MFDNQAKTIEQIKNAKYIRVHQGQFHMDDIMCIALAKKVNPNIKIIRDRDNIPEDTTDLICDCYGGFFDHHFNNQDDVKRRENGTKMASIGCLMQVLGPEVFKERWKEIDENIISKFDDADLGIKGEFLSSILGKLNPVESKNENEETQVKLAIDFCDKILDSLIETEKTPKNIENYLKKYFEEKSYYGNIDTCLQEYYGNYGEKLKEFLFEENSVLSNILSGLNEEKAKDFLYEILDIERKTYEIRKETEEKLEKIRLDCIEQDKRYIAFDEYPGNIGVFADSPVQFVIFKQTGTTKYCINTVSINEKVDNGFPPAKVPFPKELSGRDTVLRKEVDVMIPTALSYLDSSEFIDFKNISNIFSNKFESQITINSIEDLLNYKNKIDENFLNTITRIESYINFDEISKNLTTILDRPIEIFNIGTMEIFKNNIEEELKSKANLLEIFTEKGLEFVHPQQFFIQTKDKESAINFIEELLCNEEYLQKCAVKHFNDYIDKNDLNPDFKNTLQESCLSSKEIEALTQTIKENPEKDIKEIFDSLQNKEREL